MVLGIDTIHNFITCSTTVVSRQEANVRSDTHHSEPLHVLAENIWIWTFQLLNHIQTLIECSKHISDRTGKRYLSMLSNFLKLQQRIKKCYLGAVQSN